MLTPDGTDLRIAVSSLIKHLRRGREVEALYWSRQIEVRYPKYVWRRLRIFASEDVGLADDHAAVLVDALASSYAVLRAERSTPAQSVDSNLLAHAVLYLARCPNSRETDCVLEALVDNLQPVGWVAPIPDEALDLHTPQGRESMSIPEQWVHWYEAASIVRPVGGFYDWRLWLMRWAAHVGVYTLGFVERLGERWDREGRLVFGLEGYEAARFDWRTVRPQFEDWEPVDADPEADTWA